MTTSALPAAFLRAAADCPAFRISPQDTNYFALLYDEQGEGCALVAVVEIFEPGGATPPNTHVHACELFYVLEGEGMAHIDGGAGQPLRRGDALLVRPGHDHVVRNTGTGKLYCLTVMAPDEDFGALIRRGTPVALDAHDQRVLRGL